MSTPLTTRIKYWIPALTWLPGYQRQDLRGDLVAGITVAMMLIPQAMSYAMLAGLPPYVGLYASVIPLIIYALFGTSRQLAVGPVAMVALLVASGVGALAEVGSAHYIALAVLLALMVGVIQFGMGIFRLGFLTNFLSHPVISGFTSAAALIIGFSQLQHLIGLSLPRTENIAVLAWAAATQWADINIATLSIGLGGVAGLLLLKRLNPLLPGAMIVVVIATLAVWLLGLDEHHGVHIVGSVPAGFPELSAPSVNTADMMDLLPIAITIAFIGFVESIAVAKKIAAEKRYDVDPNRELVGLGLANIGAAFFKAMPVTGGFSRTAVNRNAGANTGLASIITAVLIGLALLLATPLFYYIPTAALAAVIMVAVAGLIDTHEVKHLWQVKRDDLTMLGIAFFATLILGVKVGIFVAVGASMVWFVVRTTRPHYAILGRVPGTRVYRNLKRVPDAETTPGVLAIRFDAQFYYGNVSFLKETIRAAEQQMNTPLQAVVLDASSINQLDSSADTALHELLDDYRRRGVDLFVANVKGPVRDVMERSGFVQKLGADHFYLTTDEAMQAAENTTSA
ncbi:MAG: solute carrier family 26 protein [Natronospirillum sp.]|uniref:SulP family inorganic anion transporter n=1 Tax=Natronospirillum sp. TaxID=2812955 RepID=UPI0025F1FC2D|nr:solute carrier family 26 protein [Natronospirillum sp.]MCH8550356.1 solute carrier family 26 protein [Natronospirillum sp.]